MTWKLVAERTYPGWNEYPPGAIYEQHTTVTEIWAWKDAPEAAKELLAKWESLARNEGVIPLRGKAWVSYDPVLYDKIKVEFAVGKPYAASLGTEEVLVAGIPLIPIAIVIGVIILIEWLRPGTVTDVISWILKQVGEKAVKPVLKGLMPLLVLGVGAYVAIEVLK